MNFSPGGLSAQAARPRRYTVSQCVGEARAWRHSPPRRLPGQLPFCVAVRPRVLVCGWSGAGNVGDELLTEVLSTRLRSAGLDPVIRSVSPNATAAAHGGVAVAQRGFASVRAAFTVDAVVLGPGGIVQDHSSVWSLPAHLAPVVIARLRRRPVAGSASGRILFAAPCRGGWCVALWSVHRSSFEMSCPRAVMRDAGLTRRLISTSYGNSTIPSPERARVSDRTRSRRRRGSVASGPPPFRF